MRARRAERQGELRRRVVAGPHEGVHALALKDRDLRDDMRRRAETVDADGLRRPRHLQRAPADEPGAEQRRQSRGLGALGQRETVGSVGDRMGGVAAVARIAGEERVVAKIFARAHAIGTMPASMTEPRHADARAGRKARHARARRDDAADDFMSGNDGELRLCQLAVDDMKIRAADAAGFDAQQQLSRAGRRERTLFHEERRSRAPQDHGGHLRHFAPSPASRLLRKMRLPPGGKSAMLPTGEYPSRS